MGMESPDPNEQAVCQDEDSLLIRDCSYYENQCNGGNIMQQVVTEPEVYIETKMKQFKLVDMRQQYPDLIAEAEMTAMGYQDFLVRLLSVEEEGKNARRTGKLF